MPDNKRQGYVKKYRSSAKGKATTKRLAVAYHLANPDRARATHLAKLGWTLERYEHFKQAQDNKCAICGKNETATHHKYNTLRRLCCDHDHTLMAARALLCDRCNTLLGKAGDDIELLSSAVAYLKRWKNVS